MSTRELPMQVLFDGSISVHYGQFYVLAHGAANPDLTDAFARQSNGLVGAAVANALFLITGLHTGAVGLRVVLHEGAPPIEDGAAEVVEASFVVGDKPVVLQSWAGQMNTPLMLPAGPYRIRYSGRGMELGQQTDTLLDGEPPVEHWLLEFWPAPPAPDRVLRQTSDVAAYWHGNASGSK